MARIHRQPAAGQHLADPRWPQWYASRRLLPYLRLAIDAGALRPADGRLVEAVVDRIGSLAGPAEPPSRIHGDCWAGNVLWSGDRGWLIDPAAHGGHRETDLAMLALFGAPHLDRIMAGYNDTVPLAAGWKDRIPAAPAASAAGARVPVRRVLPGPGLRRRPRPASPLGFAPLLTESPVFAWARPIQLVRNEATDQEMY